MPKIEEKFLMEEAFDLQAKVGLTKHLGARRATQELVNRLGITEKSLVLDVGCGAGFTPCYLARTLSCKVIGIDIRPAMIQRCKERAQRMNVQDKVEFRVADAYKLPFKSNTFDVVMSESVLAMLSNRKKALKEYIRVAKKGGLVGSNEVIWIKKPTPGIVKIADNLMGKKIPTIEGWALLFKSAGLKKVTTRTHPLDMKEETVDRFKQLGWMETLIVLTNALKLLFTDPSYMKVAKGALGTPTEIISYWGYAIITGKK